jgi:hypothetical protein
MLVRHFCAVRWSHSDIVLTASQCSRRRYSLKARKRQPVSLTLHDHLFNFAFQEMIDLPGIIDLAATFAISVCSATVSTIGEVVGN